MHVFYNSEASLNFPLDKKMFQFYPRFIFFKYLYIIQTFIKHTSTVRMLVLHVFKIEYEND